jgi:metallo-beta-lactamase family protein
MTSSQKNKIAVTFYGGTGSVTGANFLVEYGKKKFLIDCGMFQGEKEAEDKNFEDFPYNPSEIDVLIITHAHQDHIGRVPKLVKDGFKGIIYSTLPTLELSEIMLDDTADILAYEAKQEDREPLYTKEDVGNAMSLWKGLPYHNEFEFLPGITFTFRDAGHVLGSAMVELHHAGRRILFTGDLGNSPSPLLHDIEEIDNIDYVIMESVYGDRNHDQREDRTKDLEYLIKDTVQQKGVLMIPAFSLERTQELLAELNAFVEHNKIPPVDIYLDSPLAARVTEVYQKSTEYFNKETRSIINHGDNIFQFPGLKITSSVEESKAINDAPSPKIVIAGSGMMNGGRILHHAMRYLDDSNNILLFVGYQSAGTLGRIIQEGSKKVKIYREEIPVRARIESIQGYSGHAGSDELVEFIDQVKHSVKKVFCVMGEPSSSMFLAQRLRDNLGVYAVAPEEAERVELEL